jgi:hypothetical protein
MYLPGFSFADQADRARSATPRRLELSVPTQSPRLREPGCECSDAAGLFHLLRRLLSTNRSFGWRQVISARLFEHGALVLVALKQRVVIA